MLRRMNRALRFAAYLAATAVFLLATAHFTLRYKLNTPKFKEALTGFVERQTGRAADYDRVDYSLFPFSLVVRNATIREADGAETFASVREFSAAIDFRAKEISSLRLDRPTLRVVRRPDGSFNFSDLLPAPVPDRTGPGPSPKKPSGGGETPAESPRPAPGPAVPAFSVRQVIVDGARFEFVRQSADRPDESFVLPDFDLALQDVAADRPVRMSGAGGIGRSSSFRFDLSGPALAGNLSAWPGEFRAELEIRDFEDVRAFLPPDVRPFHTLQATLRAEGAPADWLKFRLDVRTSETAEIHPDAPEYALEGEGSLPPAVAAHLLDGAELPEEFRYAPPPCAPPPGTVSLLGNPALALALRHAQATVAVRALLAAYGSNSFSGEATFHLAEGQLALDLARISIHGGTVEARGGVQLLSCPLAWRLDRLAADELEIGSALAANGLAEPGSVSGTLHLDASASGTGFAEPALRETVADAQVFVENLQTVGEGGSPMDQVWRQLDNPLLLQLLPRVKAKVEQAKQAASATVTTRYDQAAATVALRGGRAALSDVRLGMPGYRLRAAGDVFPFDDRIELAARLLVSPEETAELTGGKDRSDVLPYEDGGLVVPLAVRGSLRAPDVLPDVDFLLRNALSGIAGGDGKSPLDSLSKSDRENVEKGLKILGDLLQP